MARAGGLRLCRNVQGVTRRPLAHAASLRRGLAIEHVDGRRLAHVGSLGPGHDEIGIAVPPRPLLWLAFLSLLPCRRCLAPFTADALLTPKPTCDVWRSSEQHSDGQARQAVQKMRIYCCNANFCSMLSHLIYNDIHEHPWNQRATWSILGNQVSKGVLAALMAVPKPWRTLSRAAWPATQPCCCLQTSAQRGWQGPACRPRAGLVALPRAPAAPAERQAGGLHTGVVFKSKHTMGNL